MKNLAQTRQMRGVRRAHGNAGSALVLALLFVSLFGIITAALLGFGFAGEKTDQVVRGTRDQRYAADGAVDGAIKHYETLVDSGNSTPCAGHTDEDADPPFFTYTVHDKIGKAWCTGSFLGSTPNPVQSLLPTGISSTDFVPYNTTTSKTLEETLQHMESAIAPGFGGGLPSGKTVYTSYPHASPTPNTVSFTFGLNPVVGATYQQVLAVVSHREGDGPGDAPNQEQYLTIETRDMPGGPVIDCTPGTTRYVVPDAKATGGPAWPIPPYQTIDVTNQRAAGGLNNWGIPSSTPCINTPARVENAVITYNAVCTSGCGSLRDHLDTVTLCICLRAMPSTAVSQPVCNPSPVDGDRAYFRVFGGNGGQKDCTQGHNPVAVGQPATPDVGIFQPNEPMLVGRVNCGSDGVGCPFHTTARFGGNDLGVTKTLTLTNWSWPAIGAVTFVTLRVSHLEERPNLVPSVTISFPGSNCPDPIPIDVSNGGFREYAEFLSPGCAPDTAAKMAGLTLTYTIQCLASYQGTPYAACGGGGNSNPDVFLDSITLDLEYELGGEGERRSPPSWRTAEARPSAPTPPSTAASR